MKNTGYHTYTESQSENSDLYLLPRDKSGLWTGRDHWPSTKSCGQQLYSLDNYMTSAM